MDDFSFIRRTLELAQRAADSDEVPVGALVVKRSDQRIIGEGYNQTRSSCDITAHAEMIAIRQACETLGSFRLDECDLYVSLEPCAMCAGAISHARINRLIYGAYDPKGGAVDHGPAFFSQATCLHAPDVISGILESECGEILKTFFGAKR